MTFRLGAKVTGFKGVKTALKDQGQRVVNAISDEIKMMALEVEKGAKLRAPVDTGRLRGSYGTFFGHRGGTLDYATVGTNVEYALHVEFGTRPHVIKVKKKKVLASRTQIFGKVVNHPGTRARPHLIPALNEVKRTMTTRMQRVLKRTSD